MPRCPRLVVATVCLVAAAIAAPVASAAPGDRADAAAIRKATIALHGYILAQKPAIEASLRQLESPVCVKAFKGMPDSQTEALFSDFLAPALFQMLLHPLQNGMNKLVADLNGLELSDPTLRSGRAGWRVMAARFAALAPPPSDLCAPLDAWRQAGYPANARPKIDDPTVAALLSEDPVLERAQRKLNRSGERLSELGVSTRVVRWWTGETLLDDIALGDEFEG